MAHINKLKIIDKIEIEKPFFSKDLIGLEWENITPFAILTGKNGVGKSKLLKLIRYYLNNKNKNIALNYDDNGQSQFQSDNFHVELVHFDDNLTDLRDFFYHRNTNSGHWEFNFGYENTTNKVVSNYTATEAVVRQKSKFFNILDLLKLVFENKKENDLNKDLRKCEIEVGMEETCFFITEKENAEVHISKLNDDEKIYILHLLCQYKNIYKECLNDDTIAKKINIDGDKLENNPRKKFCSCNDFKMKKDHEIKKNFIDNKIKEFQEQKIKPHDVNTVIDKCEFQYKLENVEQLKFQNKTNEKEVKTFEKFPLEDKNKIYNMFWISSNFMDQQTRSCSLKAFINRLLEGIDNIDIEAINKSIDPARFKYKLSYIQDQPFFTHKGYKLAETELTMGQRIILVSFLWKYRAESLRGTQKPILLLDEPDGFLHPSSIKILIENIKGLIKDYDAQVILTTHNAATLSLIDNESVFLMELNPDGKIKILNKEETNRTRVFQAINDGLVFTLEPLKIVFIEGEGDDFKFYNYFYRKLINKGLNVTIPLIFRSIGSNHFIQFFDTNLQKEEDVKIKGKKIYKDLYNYIYGITDGDLCIDKTKAIEFNEKFATENEIKKLKAILKKAEQKSNEMEAEQESNEMDKAEQESNEMDKAEQKSNQMDKAEQKSNEMDKAEQESNEMDKAEQKSNQMDKAEQKSKEMDKAEQKSNEMEAEQESNEMDKAEQESNEMDKAEQKSNQMDKAEQKSKEMDKAEQKSNEMDKAEQESNEMDKADVLRKYIQFNKTTYDAKLLRLERRNLENYIYDPINLLLITKKLFEVVKTKRDRFKHLNDEDIKVFQDLRKEIFGDLAENVDQLEEDFFPYNSADKLQNLVEKTGKALNENIYVDSNTKSIADNTEDVVLFKEYNFSENNAKFTLKYPSFLLYGDAKKKIKEKIVSALKLDEIFDDLMKILKMQEAILKKQEEILKSQHEILEKHDGKLKNQDEILKNQDEIFKNQDEILKNQDEIFKKQAESVDQDKILKERQEMLRINHEMLTGQQKKMNTQHDILKKNKLYEKQETILKQQVEILNKQKDIMKKQVEISEKEIQKKGSKGMNARILDFVLKEDCDLIFTEDLKEILEKIIKNHK